MTGTEEARLVRLVEQAKPGRIARHADEWERCGRTLENAVAVVEAAAARHTEIGGSTGPALARALALAAHVLRVKADDLHRGSAALRDVAAATEHARQERQRVQRDRPRQGAGAAFVEEESRRAADEHEGAFRRGIAVMKSIEVGDDPRTASIPAETPTVVVPTRPWPPDPDPVPPVGIHPGDPEWDHPDDVVGSPSGATPGSVPGAVPGATPGVAPGALGGAAGAAALGVGGAAAGLARLLSGARSAPPTAAPPLGRIGAAGTGSTGVLGGAGAGGSRGAAGAGTSGAGAAGRGAAGRGAPSATGAGARAGGRRGGRDRDQGEADRDLHDDGSGWLDDEGAPGILR